jgi:ribosome maturation factor RimP
MGDTPFTLEVTSPGVDRPLTVPRHFAKNIERLLKVTKNDGEVISGRLSAQSEVDITISITEKKVVRQLSIALADIKRAQVEIEFSRKDSGE